MALLKNKQKIRIRVFVEVLGWPAEKLNDHLKNILSILTDKLEWKITKEDYAEPEKKGEKVFASHVEFEAELYNTHQLFMFAIMHGPSVVEILEPAEIYISAHEMQDILSDLISKAQTMDKEIKVLASQNHQFKVIFGKLEEAGILKKKPVKDEKSSE